MSIGDIIPGTPLGTEAVSFGDDQIRGLKGDVQESFPAFGQSPNGVVSKTAGELNDTAEKGKDETVSGEWTFSGILNVNNTLVLGNQNSLVGKSTGGANRTLAVVSNTDLCQLGGNTIKTEIRAGTTDIDSIRLDGNSTVGGDLVVTGNIADADVTGNVTVGAQLRFGTITAGATGGVVSEKIQVFDDAGVALGFLAIFPL